jgi:curved DNA-binding protein CbpA
MSFTIEQGLFSPEFTDYHAILGVPVDADPKDIRKQYLKIARRLHPDSCVKESESDRQKAADLLTRMVNPAYEKLSQEKNYSEYCVLLRLKGQQALRQQETIVLTTEAARKLAGESELDSTYRMTVKELSEKQYEHLNQTLQVTGQISELNLVYLMRKDGKIETLGARPAAAATSGGEAGTKPSPVRSTPKPPPTRMQLIEAHLRRAQEFEMKQDFAKAILELREASQIDPKNGHIHTRLGSIYLKSNQPTMAKIHFNAALKMNPQDQTAIAALEKLDSSGTKAKTATQTPAAKGGKPNSAGKPNPKDKSGDNGGGLFGLFGGKKK